MHTVNIQISLYVNISDEPLVIVYAFCAEFRFLVSNNCWNSKNTIFTLIVIKLVLISVPTMYLSYSYNLIATHKILRTPNLGAPLLGR